MKTEDGPRPSHAEPVLCFIFFFGGKAEAVYNDIRRRFGRKKSIIDLQVVLEPYFAFVRVEPVVLRVIQKIRPAPGHVPLGCFLFHAVRRFVPRQPRFKAGAEFHKEEAPYNFYYRWKGSKMRKMKGSKNIPIWEN